MFIPIRLYRFFVHRFAILYGDDPWDYLLIDFMILDQNGGGTSTVVLALLTVPNITVLCCTEIFSYPFQIHGNP